MIEDISDNIITVVVYKNDKLITRYEYVEKEK